MAAPPIEVTKVNLNSAKNQSEHHTLQYDTPTFVVRRGQKFTVTLTSAKVLPEGTKLVSRASFALKPVSQTRYTRKPSSFEVDAVATVISGAGKEISVDLWTPGTTPIGRYTHTLHTHTHTHTQHTHAHMYTHTTHTTHTHTQINRYEMTLTLGTGSDVTVVHDDIMLIVLFNPWSKGVHCMCIFLHAACIKG